LTDDVDGAQQTAGEKARSGHVRAAGPPARPPPPKSNGLQTASPAHGGAFKAPSPKNAFDDLDDSIREAFGGSPSKSFPLQGGGAAVGLQGQQQPVAGIFGSSSQQHAFAPNTQTFSSPVKGVSNIDSVAAIGGGSL
jgi:hypothetical protein